MYETSMKLPPGFSVVAPNSRFGFGRENLAPFAQI
jgi:hypothetical protein